MYTKEPEPEVKGLEMSEIGVQLVFALVEFSVDHVNTLAAPPV